MVEVIRLMMSIDASKRVCMLLKAIRMAGKAAKLVATAMIVISIVSIRFR